MATQQERSRKHYLLHREETLARVKAYDQSHPDEVKARKAAFLASHPGYTTQKSREWVAAHPEEWRAYHNAWERAHPETGQVRQSRRRARIRVAAGNYTAQEWRDLVEASGHRCFYCGRTMQRLSVDHVIPLSRGGTNDISNIVPACKSCNSKKKDKPLSEWNPKAAKIHQSLANTVGRIETF